MNNLSSSGLETYLSRSSTLSDVPSPNTPTFSLKSHSRIPSSTSSLAPSPTMRESIDGFGSPTRPLTDVKEEPHDKDEDEDMVSVTDEPDGYKGTSNCVARSLAHYVLPRSSVADSYVDEAVLPMPEQEWSSYNEGAPQFSSAYDFEHDATESEFAPSPSAKRRRADSSPLSPIDGLTSRFASRMPSLSRTWRSRKPSPPVFVPDRSQEPASSRANSTRTGRSRAPSVAGSTVEAGESKGVQLPSTPTRSAFEGSPEESYFGTNHHEEKTLPEETIDREANSTTPLLPPIMTEISAHIREVPYQSPLQSPTVVDPEPSSVLNSPLPTPRINGLPSPPLSSKPSTSSFHRQRGLSLTKSSSDVPPLQITDPNDQWANQLGHANFNISPEPYVPEQTHFHAYRQYRADWDNARQNYMNHLERTGENYGRTSKIYRLTEEKWASIDATWKRNGDFCFPRATDNPIEVTVLETTTSHRQSEKELEPAPGAKIPVLSEGKFPMLGEGGIVGPMEQLPSIIQQPQRRKRKLGFFRWVQGVWPAGAGVFGRSAWASS